MAITITHDNTILLNSIHVNVDDNQYYKYVSSEILYFKKDSNYELTYRAISNVSNPLILFVTSSGGTDAFNYDSNFGKPISTPTCTLNTIEEHRSIFKADYDGTGSLCFAFKYGDYYIADIKLLPYQGINYSPDNAVITIPTPESKRNEKMSISVIYRSPDGLRVGDPESYLSNSGYPISETDYNDVTGSNLLISNDDNLIEGSLFVGKSLRSGIEIAGTNSAFIRSIGFHGFTSASNGWASPGFLIYSGSVLPSSGDSYAGVGMDMVLDGSKYFRFRTVPSQLDIHTDSIFIGNPGINYISASDGKIEISSSNFLLSSSGDVIMKGTVYADAGVIAGLYIKSASIQNSPEINTSTLLFGSQSYYYNATNFDDRTIVLQSGTLNGTLLHDNSIYTGTINPDPTGIYYFFVPGFGNNYFNVQVNTSDAYTDLEDPGYLRVFFKNLLDDYTIYDISYNSVLLNIDILMAQYFNEFAEYNGTVKFGIQYYNNSTPLNTVLYDLIPANNAKDSWKYQEYSISEYSPANANKFKCWFDFYSNAPDDVRTDYRLYDVNINYQRELLEISPDGFFYRSNENKYIKLGRGTYEIKGDLIEADRLQSHNYVLIGSGSYDSGLLNIKQYQPFSSSGFLISFDAHNVYQWINSNGSYNLKSHVQTEASLSIYYNFYGDDVLVYNVYKDFYSNNIINLGSTYLQFSSSNYIYSDTNEQMIFNSYAPHGKYYKFMYNDIDIINIYSSSAAGYVKNRVEITGSVRVTGSMYVNDKLGGQTNSGEVLTFSKNVTAAVGITATSSLQNDIITNGSITLISGACRLYPNKEYTGLMYRYELPNSTTFYTSSTYATPDANSYIKDGSINYIIVEYNNGNPRYRITQNVEEINESDIFPVYTLYRSSSVINWIDWDSLGRGLPNRLHQRLVKTQRFAREDGINLYTNASAIGITNGRAWIGAVRHSFSLVESDITNTRIFYQNSSNTWASEAIAGFDNARWNNLSTYTLDSLSPNSYNVNWIYRNMVDIDSPYSTYISIILGSANKATLDEIRAVQPPSTLPVDISAMGVLVGKIIVRQGVATAIEIYSAWATSFIGSGVGGDGSGSITTHNNLLGLQGGTTNEYYHATYSEYTGTGTGIFVREKDPTLSGTVTVDGTLIADSIIAGSITETSDERLKSNIVILENQLDSVNKLSPKRYNFIRTPEKDVIGLIAQEVQKIYPEFVHNKDGILSIEYSKLTSVLIKSVQELSDKNKILEDKINELEYVVQNLYNFLNK